MSYTRKQKGYALALGLALGTLALDQLAGGGELTGPAQAVAVEPDASPTPETKHPLSRPMPVLAGPTLSDRIASAADGTRAADEAVDAFAIAESWLAPPAPVAEVAAPTVTEIDRFRARHRLEAVMADARGRGIAVIGGKPIRVGEVFDGFTLESVGMRTARWVSPAGEVELRLPEVQ